MPGNITESTPGLRYPVPPLPYWGVEAVDNWNEVQLVTVTESRPMPRGYMDYPITFAINSGRPIYDNPTLREETPIDITIPEDEWKEYLTNIKTGIELKEYPMPHVPNEKDVGMVLKVPTCVLPKVTENIKNMFNKIEYVTKQKEYELKEFKKVYQARLIEAEKLTAAKKKGTKYSASQIEELKKQIDEAEINYMKSLYSSQQIKTLADKFDKLKFSGNSVLLLKRENKFLTYRNLASNLNLDKYQFYPLILEANVKSLRAFKDEISTLEKIKEKPYVKIMVG